jgi:hypothetical protein
MSNILNNGTVLPSSLLSSHSADFVSAFNKTYESVQLRAGIVIASYDIDNKQNIRKTTPEYDVLVMEQDRNRGTTTTTYRNVITIDSFGGMADFFEFKRRPQAKNEKKDFHNNDGQLVLILCLDGSSEKAIIIGGVKHAKRLTKLTAEAGLHLEGEYNGLNWQIDKDGALKILFKSPTDNEGKVKNEKLSGTNINIKKDGTLQLTTQDLNKPELNESLTLDKTNQSLSLTARKNTSITTGGDFTNSIKGSFNNTVGKDLSLNITGSSAITSKSLTATLQDSLTIKAKSAQMTYESDCNIQAKKIDLAADSVAVGQGASALAVLGPQLLAWLNTHTHVATAPGAPTTAPMAPAPSSVLSNTVTIKP